MVTLDLIAHCLDFLYNSKLFNKNISFINISLFYKRLSVTNII